MCICLLWVIKMNDIFIVAEKEINAAIKNKKSLGTIIFTMVLMIAIPICIYISMMRDIKVPISDDMSNPASMFLELFVNIFCFNYSIALPLLFIYGLAFDAFFGEKMKKTIETLLATPLTPRSILLGKTLGIFSIAYPATIIATIGFVLAVNLVAQQGILYLPGYLALVHLFIILPLLCFFIIGVVGEIQLIVRDFKAGNFIIFAIGFLFLFIPSIVGRELTTPKNMVIIYLVLTGVMALLMYFLMRFITKERIIISS